MNEIIKHMTQRIEEARREYEKIHAQRVALSDQEQMLAADIKTWEKAKEAELRRSGGTVPAAAKTQVATVVAPIAHSNGNGHGQTHESAIEAILYYIADAQERGITRKEIAIKLASDNIHVHRNYPYVAISKLKEKGLVEEQNGRLTVAQ
jgi:hypothetical protein